MMKIGWSTRDFTPERPALLMGQMHVRVAREAMDPLTLTAMAIDGGVVGSRAMMISLDMTHVSSALQAAVRQRLRRLLPTVPSQAIILCTTHTHESLVIEDGIYTHPGGDVMTADECARLIEDKAVEAACEAWQSRRPSAVHNAFGHAVVGHNRRASYADGHTAMYGATNVPDFRMIEGYEDHSLDMLFVWDRKGRLVGVVLAIPCPSQVDENINRFSADYWHEIRVELRRRLGKKLSVLPLCGAAGDQSPHFLVYGREEAEMRRRRNVSERQEIAVRVADAVERALVCTDPETGAVPVVHQYRRVSLTGWHITKAERDWAKAECRRALARGDDPASWWPRRLQAVVDAFDGRKKAPRFAMELHSLRIGSLGIVTNPIELYLDYALRIKAQSPAPQTVVVQLAGGSGLYLPTERAIGGGSYGAMPVVSSVGPEGGQELVEVSLEALRKLFPTAKKR